MSTCWSSPCYAQADAALHRSQVVVIADRDGSPALSAATQRLVGELRGAGFDVTVVDHVAGSDPRKEAENRAEGSHGADGQPDAPPFAALTLVPAGNGNADIWVVDRITKKTVVRHLTTDDAPDTLAIHASELLRASLLEILTDPQVALPADVSQWLGPLPERAPAPAASPAPPVPPALAGPPSGPMVAPRPLARPGVTLWMEDYRGAEHGVEPAHHYRMQHSVLLGVGVAGLFSYRGMPPAVGPIIDVRYRFKDAPVELDASLAAPIASSDVGDPNDATEKATLRHGTLGVSALYRPLADDFPVRPGIGAGLGAYLIDVKGHTTFSGTQAFHHDSVSFAPSLTADLQFRFHERVRGFVSVSALFVLPEPVVILESVPEAQAGEPLFLTSAGIAIAL